MLVSAFYYVHNSGIKITNDCYLSTYCNNDNRILIF